MTVEAPRRYVGALVVANDVSARDVQLPQRQFYKGKSYRTFCPVGPYLWCRSRTSWRGCPSCGSHSG